MKSVQILGMAANLALTPSPSLSEEVWCSNNPRGYRVKYPTALKTWTHWFNLHSSEHIRKTYPQGYLWYQQQDKPILLRDGHDLLIETSLQFPSTQIQEYFAHEGKPFRFFTCSLTWQLAYALISGFDKVSLFGFELKRDHQYDFERPCAAYWVQRLRNSGVDVYLPPDVDLGPPGDPRTYTDPLYGLETTLPHLYNF